MAGAVHGGRRDGERVAIDPAIPCGHCDLCRRGYRNLCRNIVFAGHSTCDGGLREVMAWPTHLLHPLPDTVDDADGALLEPLGVAIHAVDLSHVGLGADAAVIGCGPIGLCLIQLLRLVGARTIVACDPLAHRRAAAASAGADVVLDPGEVGYDDRLQDATAGVGVDVAFEVAGTDAADRRRRARVASRRARRAGRHPRRRPVVVPGRCDATQRAHAGHGAPHERRLSARDRTREHRDGST